MAKLQLPEGWFSVPITGPQFPVVEWLVSHLPAGMTLPITSTTKLALPRDLEYLTEIVQILGVDYRRAYESDPMSVPARPVTADAIVSNIRSGARGALLRYDSERSEFIYEYDAVPDPNPDTRERVVDTSDVKGQIELALENALAEIEPELHAQLQAAYRENAEHQFAYFMENACKPHPPNPRTSKRDVELYEEHLKLPQGWREAADYDEETAKEIFTGYHRIDPRHYWSTMCEHPELYTLTYEHADKAAKDHLDNAHRSFVSKNLQKLMFVIGDRKDFAEIVIQVAYRNGTFVGTVDLRLSDTEIHADLELKYVLRTIPNLTPYWQYPLTFSRVIVGGREVAQSSFGIIPEEDARKAVTGKRAPTKGEEAVKKGLCSMSGAPVPEDVKQVRYGMRTSAECPECGEYVLIQNYKFRAHKTPETLRAELLAKGFCEMSDMPVPPDAARGKYSDERTCPVCGRSVGMYNGKFRQHKGKQK